MNFKNGVEDCPDFSEPAFPETTNPSTTTTTTTTTSTTTTPTPTFECNPRMKLSDLEAENEDLAGLWTLAMDINGLPLTNHGNYCNLTISAD